MAKLTREKKPDTSEPLTTGKPWMRAGISRSLFYRLKSAGVAPEPINLGLENSRPVYRVADIDRWIASRKPDRRVRTSNYHKSRQDAEPVTDATEPTSTA